MKKLFFQLTIFLTLLFSTTTLVSAANSGATYGQINVYIGGINKQIQGYSYNVDNPPDDPILTDGDCKANQNSIKFFGGGNPCPDESGNVYAPGLLDVQEQVVMAMFNNQISGQEYIADVLNNIGIPSVSRTYAQTNSGGGSGYEAMKPFLEFWKVFRNLAYSLYIIMFVVVGIMIMLRTKINAQTIITIQTALPNLLITLLLITFSYAIVGFMIDIMYFLIYFVVYLISSVGIIDADMSIKRLLSYSAWGVVFEGKNSIIRAVSASLQGILGSLGTGGIGFAANLLSQADKIVQHLTFGLGSPLNFFVTISFVIAMLKLMVALIKSYVMLIVQTITAPLQILMNAMPGSKAFAEWLKKTASYLIPFPVAACMFIFSAVLIGNPKDAIVANDWWPGNATEGLLQNPVLYTHQNPFGVKSDIAASQDVWLPPFTLTDTFLANANPQNVNILALIGFFVFLMTPAAVKMAQDWLQVKESPYTAEALSSLKTGYGVGIQQPIAWGKSIGNMARERRERREQAGWIGKAARGEKY